MVAQMKGVQHTHCIFTRLMHQWTWNTYVVLLLGLTLVSNCVQGSVHPQHSIRARRQQIRLERIRRGSSKTMVRKTIVLKSNNREEPKILTYVISNNFSIPDLQMRPPVIWEANGICHGHSCDEVNFLQESRWLYDELNRIGCLHGLSFLLTPMVTEYKQVMRDRTTRSEIFGAWMKDVTCRTVARFKKPVTQ